MAETANGSGEGERPGPSSGQPSMAVLAQYLKDLSFENPRAPAGFQEQAKPPQFEVEVNVNARGLGGTTYEVELSVSAKGRRGDDPLFVVEATYAGAFDIRNVPGEHIEAIMLVECPRLLFPFLRQIVADATRNGNYPPLMLEPIDFFAIYQRNRAETSPRAATA
jgi:preprotein translocase subunit SecB